MDSKSTAQDFRTALARNPRAAREFQTMTDYEKNSVLQWAQTLRSDEEIRQLVSNIAGGNVQNFHSGGTNRTMR